MNAEHFHLIVNHFPVVSPIIGIIVLIYGLSRSNKSIQQVAYFILIFGAAFGPISGFSGGRAAEHLLSLNLPDIDPELVHHHEETAERVTLASILMLILAGFTWHAVRHNLSRAKGLNYAVVVLSLVIIYLAAVASNTGGAIRHPEMVSGYTPTTTSQTTTPSDASTDEPEESADSPSETE